ncbi:MAG: hypothetical protein ABSG86_31955, partial [Thermoguttaceae bacterium]
APALAASGLIQDIYSHNPFPITLSPDGTLTLDANCEPAGSHTITIGTSSGGVQASVDGQSLLFAPGQVTSIDVIGGPGSNSVDVEGLPPGVSLSIQGVSSAIQGATGPNVVTIDDTSGFLSQCGSITFTGGVGGNTLILENGTFTNELETANGYQSGSIVFNNDQPIIFNNVATVDDTMSVTGTATFQSTGSNETTTAADGGVINGFNAIQLNIGGSPSFFVANKATITVAVSDAGADTVDINTPVAATGVGTLNVDMRGGSAAVTFDVLATSMVTNLYGDNTSDSFTVSSDAGIDNPPQGNLDGIAGNLTILAGESLYNRLIVSDFGQTVVAKRDIVQTTTSFGGTCGARRNSQLGNAIKAWSNCLSNSG